MADKKKVVVAFSGGLDTSYTVMKLSHDMGYEVYAACANTGGFSDEQLKQNEENAYKLGAKEYVTLDVTHEYYEKSLKYMILAMCSATTVIQFQCRQSAFSRPLPLHATQSRLVPTPLLTVQRERATTRYVST